MSPNLPQQTALQGTAVTTDLTVSDNGNPVSVRVPLSKRPNVERHQPPDQICVLAGRNKMLQLGFLLKIEGDAFFGQLSRPPRSSRRQPTSHRHRGARPTSRRFRGDRRRGRSP
jgi:hypothetical protein